MRFNICSILKFVRFKINGSVLAFTTYILIAITIILSILLLQQSIVSFYEAKVVNNIVNSADINIGIQYLLNDLDINDGKPIKINSLLNNVDEPLTLLRSRWGFFNIIGVSRISENDTIRKTAFTGYNINKQNNFCLYLVDYGSSLKLNGDARISGKAYLPASGVERGHIGNKSYTGDKLVYGKTFASKNTMPGLFYSTGDSIESFFKSQAVLIKDSFLDNFQNSFLNPTKYIYYEGAITIRNYKLIGNIIIESKSSVVVDKSSHLENIIIKAPYIRIEKGFKGSIQCFASDSLIIEEGCQLEYPSVASLVSSENNRKFKRIKIAGNTSVNGLVFVKTSSQNSKYTLFSTDENSLITGQVFCNTQFEPKGKFSGQVICTETILVTNTSVHKNHLLDVQFSENIQTFYLNILPGISGNEYKKILKWL